MHSTGAVGTTWRRSSRARAGNSFFGQHVYLAQVALPTGWNNGRDEESEAVTMRGISMGGWPRCVYEKGTEVPGRYALLAPLGPALKLYSPLLT